MTDERMNDRELDELISSLDDWEEKHLMARELIEWRKYGKLWLGHRQECGRDSEGQLVTTECTCGFDKLPAWLRGEK